MNNQFKRLCQTLGFSGGVGFEKLFKTAADRITELEALRDRLTEQVEDAIEFQARVAESQKLERKLTMSERIKERDIEQHLVKQCNVNGIYCRTWSSPRHRGVPDRILLYRGRWVAVQVKAPGKALFGAQVVEQRRIVAAGGQAIWVDSKNAVDVLINQIVENNEEQATPIEDDAMFRQCLEDYRVLFGVPPHDTMSNIAQSDGYFAASLKDKYPESMRKKASALAREEYREFEKVRAKFIGENNDE